MLKRPSTATPTQYAARIQSDAHWFQIALERGLTDEAAEIVLDWVEAWCESQRAQQDDHLAAIHRAVMDVHAEVLPFIAGFAIGTVLEDEWNYLLHWLELMDTPAAAAAAQRAREKGFAAVAETAVEQACEQAYHVRQRDAHILEYQRACEEALRELLGEVLNHGMSAGLTPVTEQFSLRAREVFFRELQRKRTLAAAASDKDNPWLQRIHARFPFSRDESLRKQAYEARWLQKLVYTFYRLVQLWLLRPLDREDFLHLCQSEGIDLSSDDLECLAHVQALYPLVPGSRSDLFHVVQLFALSAVWPEWPAHGREDPQQLRHAMDAALETVWQRLAFLTPDGERLNGASWLALTQTARERRERATLQPGEKLWTEGLANLAAAYLYAVGVRPVAATVDPASPPGTRSCSRSTKWCVASPSSTKRLWVVFP